MVSDINATINFHICPRSYTNVVNGASYKLYCESIFIGKLHVASYDNILDLICVVCTHYATHNDVWKLPFKQTKQLTFNLNRAYVSNLI